MYAAVPTEPSSDLGSQRDREEDAISELHDERLLEPWRHWASNETGHPMPAIQTIEGFPRFKWHDVAAPYEFAPTTDSGPSISISRVSELNARTSLGLIGYHAADRNDPPIYNVEDLCPATNYVVFLIATTDRHKLLGLMKLCLDRQCERSVIKIRRMDWSALVVQANRPEQHVATM
jgi:hypothetical protein